MSRLPLRRLFLWVGLALCLYALWHFRDVAGQAFQHLGMSHWLLVGLLLAAIWWSAVMAWSRYLQAYLGQRPSWRTAMRQVGLLLVGKYVPGGVFGFVSRVYDQPKDSRGRVVWAGLAEQAAGIALPVALGGLLYLAAYTHRAAWMLLVVPVPLLLLAVIHLMHRVATVVPVLRHRVPATRQPLTRPLLSAILWQTLQQLAWVLLVVVLVRVLFSTDVYAALGVAGAFWWAVALGIVAFPVPGGIGVRESSFVWMASLWLDAPQAVVLAALLRLLGSVVDAGAGGVSVVVGGSQGKGREDA